MSTIAVSQAHLERAATALGRVSPMDMPAEARQAWQVVNDALAQALDGVATAPPHATARRGPVPPATLPMQSLEGFRPLVGVDEAARSLGQTPSQVRRGLEDGTLPRYRLGAGLIRTRCTGTPVFRSSGESLTAEDTAAYFSVDKKWVYNHIGELPHCVLGMAKSFRLPELDWYLEEFRRH